MRPVRQSSCKSSLNLLTRASVVARLSSVLPGKITLTPQEPELREMWLFSVRKQIHDELDAAAGWPGLEQTLLSETPERL